MLHLPDELCLEILKHMLDMIVSTHPVTPKSHQRYLDLVKPVAITLGAKWANIVLDYYYKTNVFRLRAPYLRTDNELVIPSFAHRVRKLELVLPLAPAHFIFDSSFIMYTRDNFQRLAARHVAMLQYIFKHQHPLTAEQHQRQHQNTLVNEEQPSGPAASNAWLDRFTSLETLALVFGHWHLEFYFPFHVHLEACTAALLVSGTLYHLIFPRHLKEEVKIIVVGNGLVEEGELIARCGCHSDPEECQSVEEFKTVVRAIFTRDFSTCQDLFDLYEVEYGPW